MTALLDAPIATSTTSLTTVKGWHDDPWHSHALRYHDGTGWTDHVTHFGPVPCLTSCRHTH